MATAKTTIMTLDVKHAPHGPWLPAGTIVEFDPRAKLGMPKDGRLAFEIRYSSIEAQNLGDAFRSDGPQYWRATDGAAAINWRGILVQLGPPSANSPTAEYAQCLIEFALTAA